MALIAAASFIWYFVKLALGDAEGAERLVPLVTILFFTSVGFDQKKETTSPGVHALTNVNWVLMCAFALTIIIPLLMK